jgi:hypothetical protein
MGPVSLRAICGAVLAVAVGVLPVAPPEHVHETSEPDGHHHRLAHRHASSHLLTHGHQAAQELGDRSPVLAPDDVFVAPAAAPTLAPALRVAALLDPFLTARPIPRTEDVERLIHGPPRALVGLRAPPVSLLL